MSFDFKFSTKGKCFLKHIIIMRKILLSLVLISSFISCQQNDKPPVGPQSPEAADAEAGAKAQSAFDLGNALGSTTYSLQEQREIVASNAALGSAEYREKHGIKQTTLSTGARMLPNNLVVANNPFEIIGKLHNLYLSLFEETGEMNILNLKLKTFDRGFIKSLFEISRGTITEEEITSYISKIQATSYDEYETYKIVDTNFDSYFKMINEACNEMKINGSHKEAIASYLNSHITTILSEVADGLTSEQKIKLTYLSVYKYSYFYWNE